MDQWYTGGERRDNHRMRTSGPTDLRGGCAVCSDQCGAAPVREGAKYRKRMKECGATNSETASESERSKGCGASSGVGESGLGRKSSECTRNSLDARDPGSQA